MKNRIITMIALVTAIGMTSMAISSMNIKDAFAQGGASGCPDPGQCTCNPASGVMTDHAMAPPFNRINNGCTEQGQVP